MFKHAVIVVLMVVLVGCGTAPDAQLLPTLAPTLAPPVVADEQASAVNTPVPTETPNLLGERESVLSTLPPTWTPTPALGLGVEPASTIQASQIEASWLPTSEADTQAGQVVATEAVALAAQNQAMMVTLTAIAQNPAGAPLAEPTAIAYRDMPQTTLYVQDPARMRTCPTIDNDACPPMMEIREGETVLARGRALGDTYRDSDMWYFVSYSNTQGYIHATLLGDSPPVQPTAPVPTAIPNRALIYFFYADWCPVCQREIPNIRQLEAMYGTRLNVRWIDTEDRANQNLAAEYAVNSIPRTVIMTEDGTIFTTFFGGVGLTRLRAAVDDVLW